MKKTVLAFIICFTFSSCFLSNEGKNIMEYEENSSTILSKTKQVYDKLLEDTVKANSGYTKDSLWANLEATYEPIID